MIKLIATDMDGTLVNSNKELPENIFEIIEKLYEKDINFVVASGRQYYNLEELFAPVRDKVTFIAENGGVIYKNGRNIHTELMSKEELDEVLECVLKVDGLHPILCGVNAAYYVNDNAEFVENAHLYFERYQYVENIYDAIDMDDICKLAIYDTKGASENGYPALRFLECEEHKYKVTLSSDHWVDVCGFATNKGCAIEQLQKMFNITYDECMAFGDYMNDAEMMTKCYYSYAMANAHEDLKKLSNFEAPSNDDNGVVRVIDEKVLGKIQ